MDPYVPLKPEDLQKLSTPQAWMEVAQRLRRAADLIDRKAAYAGNIANEFHQDRLADMELIPEQLQKEKCAYLDRDMGYVSEMLYQMPYENAVKGVLALQQKLVQSHDLVGLFSEAGILIQNQDVAEYLTFSTKMNQLGRFQIGQRQVPFPGSTKKEKQQFAGRGWATQYRERRSAIDAALLAAWTKNGGDPNLAFLVHPF